MGHSGDDLRSHNRSVKCGSLSLIQRYRENCYCLGTHCRPIHHRATLLSLVSWTQAFAMRTCGGAAWERLQVKADMVLFAGNTVWFISERIRGIREHTIYKSTLTLTLPLFSFQLHSLPFPMAQKCGLSDPQTQQYCSMYIICPSMPIPASIHSKFIHCRF